MDIVKTLGKQQIAIRGTADDSDGNFRQIVNLVTRYDLHFSNWFCEKMMKRSTVNYLSGVLQSQFIEVLDNEIKRTIVTDVKNTGVYLIIADNTLDCAQEERLVISVRYVDCDGTIQQRLLDMVPVEKVTS